MTFSEKLKYASPRSLPVCFGYIFLGIAFGIVLVNAGFGVLWALGISVTVFAGSMQFVMVPMLAAGVSPLTMAVTTFFVNSRHMFYGLSFIESFKKLKEKPYMIFALSDETYSVLCQCKTEDPEEKNIEAWPFIAALDQAYWVIGSVTGAILGKALPIDFTGIDFSMTALFAVILVNQISGDRRSALPAVLAGIISSLVCLLLLGGDAFLLPSLIITVVLVGLIRSRPAAAAEGGADK